MYVNTKVLTIVSRNSNLALQQARIVQQQLQDIHPELKIEIIGISTKGDQILDRDLNKIGGKGLFVKELENYLLYGEADIAVHSMKDMPAVLPDGLALGAILKRADPRDVFVSAKYNNLQQLPPGSVVGTSSLRRQAQVLALRSDLQIRSLRGNVETRLRKLESGEYDAIILAAAGLERLGLKQWLNCPLSIDDMLPAVGQGALGIEYRIKDLAIKQLIAPLNDPNSAVCVLAERAMNAKLDGGCQAPVAGFATLNPKGLMLQGLVASPDGKTIYTAQHSASVEEAVALGEHVAQQLSVQGALKIIQSLKLPEQNND